MKRLDLRKQKEIRLDTLLTKKNVLSVMVAFFALINVYWNISAITTDVQYNYGYGKMLAEYLTDHQLDSKTALAQWRITKNSDYEIESMDTNYYYAPVVEANAYFDESIVYNREGGLTFEEHRLADDDENEKNIARWKSLENPDVVFCTLQSILEIADILDLDRDYHYEYVGETHKIWKNKELVDYLYIWVHN